MLSYHVSVNCVDFVAFCVYSGLANRRQGLSHESRNHLLLYMPLKWALIALGKGMGLIGF
jgi:hypothetical protein